MSVKNFTGPFNVDKWTYDEGTGHINTDGAPLTIELVSGNSDVQDETTMFIDAPYTGTVIFKWLMTTEDWDESWDAFYFVAGNTRYPIGLSESETTSSGTFSVQVNKGDNMGFDVNTVDGVYGSSTTVISNFVFEIPIANICFPAGTPVLTDQGYINIEDIDKNIHTIRNKEIKKITTTVTYDDHLILIKEGALGFMMPNKDTLITKNHCVYYKNKMIEARNLHKFGVKNVFKTEYDGEILYNVVMEEHNKMVVNNMIVETAHPKNKYVKNSC